MSTEGLKHKYKDYLDKYNVTEDNDSINVQLVVIKPEFRGEGIGRKLFIDINRYADYSGKVITLTPSSEFGGNKSNLRKFYKSLGFVDNKGRKRNYEYMDTMYRIPLTREILNNLINSVLSELWKHFL